ncbi:hypothetical protein COCNU_10G004090 [Cocos nucifera]|uniref:Uncharacterized protein n=1 Tax=Cocos nucifera TaxID=13894 RepID=A0A8K0ILC2_COCNU|nr:hypothetical protein COCNU_10G004090 [Cocos nucifera]
MKFGAKKAGPTHEPVIEKAPTKKYEVLPQKLPWESGMKFGASEAELTLQYVPQGNRLQSVHQRRNEVRLEEKPSSSELVRTRAAGSSPTVDLAGKRNEVRLEEKPSSPQSSSSRQNKVRHKQGQSKVPPRGEVRNEGGGKFFHGMKFGGKPNSSAQPPNEVRRRQGRNEAPTE